MQGQQNRLGRIGKSGLWPQVKRAGEREIPALAVFCEGFEGGGCDYCGCGAQCTTGVWVGTEVFRENYWKTNAKRYKSKLSSDAEFNSRLNINQKMIYVFDKFIYMNFLC